MIKKIKKIFFNIKFTDQSRINRTRVKNIFRTKVKI